MKIVKKYIKNFLIIIKFINEGICEIKIIFNKELISYAKDYFMIEKI